MRRSFNEVELMLKKAAVGAGLDVGVAEDVARAAVALCRAQWDGVAIMAAALSRHQAGGRDNSLERQITRALCDGPSILDELIVQGTGCEITLAGVDHPKVLVGLGLITAGDHRITIELAGDATALVFGADATDLQAVDLRNGTGMVVRHAGPDAAGETAMHRGPRPFCDPRHWSVLEQFAARTYVPSSEASRARGAGAGSIDND